MIKNIIIASNIIVLFLISILDGDVSVTMNAPTEVVAGTEFTIDVTIRKGSVKDFSRFQQDFPLGFYARNKESRGGDFRFQDQKVKVLWYKGGLPEDEEFTISYIVSVDPTIQGTVMLGGQFAYLEENDRKIIDVPQQAILVKPGDLTGVDPTKIKTYTEQDFNGNNNIQSSDVTCYRKKPYLDENGNIMVNLVINKANHNKYGKIQEQIPEGFKASPAEDRSDVIFSFKDQNVKFLWLSLPAEPKIVVKYKLTPIADKTVDDLNITGTFSYVSNDVTIPVDIVQKEELDLSLPTNNNLIANNTTNNNNSNNNTKTNNNSTNNNNTKSNNTSNNNTTSNNTITDPETGVKYKVQIGAYRRNLSTSYFQKLNVSEKINKELHNGLNKYIIGSHGEYKEARDHRVKIWDNTTIDDAFVTAYNNGNRITVQEALMITNQKWVK